MTKEENKIPCYIYVQFIGDKNKTLLQSENALFKIQL